MSSIYTIEVERRPGGTKSDRAVLRFTDKAVYDEALRWLLDHPTIEVLHDRGGEYSSYDSIADVKRELEPVTEKALEL